jgi:hypothetical protein
MLVKTKQKVQGNNMISGYYHVEQVPPAPQWYVRYFGFITRALASITILTAIGIGGVWYADTQMTTPSRAAQSTQEDRLKKITPAPLVTAPVENIVDVQSVLDTWIAEHPGQEWAVSVKSLSGATFSASVNADKQFDSASIYKLLILLPLFNQVPVEHQKNITLNINGAPKSIATCVDLMLRVSNNECGEAVGHYVSWRKADAVLKSAGFTNTALNSSSGLKTSAADTAKFLEELQGDMFNRNARETILTSLKQQRWRQGIPAGCPGCVVANKTGSLNGVTHDAAIIDYSGGSYVLSIFSEGASFTQIAELTGRIQQQILDTTL